MKLLIADEGVLRGGGPPNVVGALGSSSPTFKNNNLSSKSLSNTRPELSDISIEVPSILSEL